LQNVVYIDPYKTLNITLVSVLDISDRNEILPLSLLSFNFQIVLTVSGLKLTSQIKFVIVCPASNKKGLSPFYLPIGPCHLK